MSGRPVGASALLLVLRHSCWCFGTPDWCFGTLAGASTLLIGAPTLLLVLRHSCYVSRHVLIGAPALLLVLRHSCCVSRHVLISAPALLLVLRHSYCMDRHVLYGTTIPQYCIVPSGTYCTASYSFLIINLGSQKDI